MKIFFLFIFFNCALCVMNCAFAQAPLVKMWDYRFGGTGGDRIACFQQTGDGGYIVCGSSASGIGGDKTQASWGNYDYWIVKTDSFGVKQWDRDFGGTYDEILSSIQQTADGGYIVCGNSNSGISGDKTQATWGNYDYWIIKTDSLGNKQWDKDFGGTDDDICSSIQQTADGGYILGGHSLSNISGDKTAALRGSYDYWIVKTDSLGNKQWDKDFGGTDYDWLLSLQQNHDGGYILGGFSLSGVSIDKTAAGWGGYEYWIVKTDSLGNRQWDKDFGGTDNDMFSSLQQTADGGYILGGLSQSVISGDKTQPLWGNYDFWIVKTDSLGNKQWDKDFGGTDSEELWTVSQTTEGGFLISGDSYSPISGDKSENNLGLEQTWVVKTDSLGIKQWDKTIFTSGHDEQGLAIQTRDGCYAMINSATGGIAGYKTQDAWNNTVDYWIIKFCETLQANFTSPSFICPGTCIDFTNLSFNATACQWSFAGAIPNISAATNPTNICYASPGTYDVQLIASNANGSDTLLLTNYITVYPTPPPQSITQSGDTLLAIAGATSYQWYFNGNVINGATNYFYVAPASGDYNVVATDVNGCEVEAAVFNVIASVQEIGDQEILIFPNPVEDKFSILNAQFTRRTAAEISIYNVIGEKIAITSAVIQNQSAEINVQSLTQGLYYLEVKSSEKIFRTKFVKL